MRRFISETAPVDKLKEITDPHAALAKAVMNVTDNGIYRLLNSRTIQRIDALLGQMNEPKLRQFTDSAYIGLIIHIAISVERMQQGNVPSDEQSLPLEEDGEDLRAKTCAWHSAFSRPSKKNFTCICPSWSCPICCCTSREQICITPTCPMKRCRQT